jgi:hypothetical protein
MPSSGPSGSGGSSWKGKPSCFQTPVAPLPDVVSGPQFGDGPVRSWRQALLHTVDSSLDAPPTASRQLRACAFKGGAEEGE